MKTLLAIALAITTLIITTQVHAEWKLMGFMDGNAAVIKSSSSDDMIAVFCIRLPSNDKFTGIAYINKRHAMNKHTQLQFEIPGIPEFALGVDFVWQGTEGQIVKVDIGRNVNAFLHTARTSKFMTVTISRNNKVYSNESQHFNISKTSALNLAWDIAYRGC